LDLEGDIDGLIHLSDISEDEDPKEALGAIQERR
jgi:ribosomal protein S1